MPDNTYTAKTRLLAPVPRSKRMRDANVTVATQSSSSQQVEQTWNRDTESVQDAEVLVPVAQPLIDILRLRNGNHIVNITVDNNGNLHVDAGLYSDSFVSALGANPGGSSGSSSGGGIDITDLLNILNGTTDISEYTASKTIATSFLGNAITALTKQMVEAVLTGNITSHVHSQYQTVLTGLVTSHTHSTLAMAHSNEINFTNSAGQYRFWFNYRDGDTDAMNPNNLITDYFFGNRNGVANARLNAGSMLLTGGVEVGGDILPTTSFTNNLGAYSQSWNRIITRYIDTASTYDLRVCTYGTERLHINASDGHVGIGTTSPTGMLHINQSAWSDGLVLQRAAQSGGCGIKVLDGAGTQLGIMGFNGSKQFEVDINSTQYALITSSITQLGRTDISDYGLNIYSSTARLRLLAYSNGNTYIQSGNSAFTASADLHITGHESNNITNLYLQANNVRLPSGSLLFMNTDAAGIYLVASGISWHNSSNSWVASCLYFDANGYTIPQHHIMLDGANASSSTSNTTQLVWRASGTQQVALSSNANALVINPTTSGTTGQIVLGVNSKASYFTSSGNFGIGTSSPAYKLHVSGDICATGAVTALVTSSSDRRLKTDIKEFDALSIVDMLKPKSFRWNSTAKALDSAFDTNDTQYGLIAQEVEEVMPSLAFKFKHNDYYGVRYEKLIPVLLEAIKELKQEINQLKEARV